MLQKKTALGATMAVVAVSLSLAQADASEIIFSNFDGLPLNPNQPGTLSVGLGIEGSAAAQASNGIPQSLAVSFTANGNYSLTQLDLGFFPLSTRPTPNGIGGYSASVEVSLERSLSGRPEDVISSWTQDVGANGLLTLNSTGVYLSAGSQYFLTVAASDPNSYVAWGLAGSSATAPLFYDRGAGWLPADANLFPNGTYDLLSKSSVAFDALGNPSPVPIPGALWLLMSGVAGVGLIRTRSRRLFPEVM